MMSPSNILVIKPSSLGDVVHALPAVHFLKQQWPDAQISWVVNPEWACLLEGNPDVDRVVIFPRRTFRGLGGVVDFWNWSEALADPRPDLVLDFQGLLRSGLMSLRSTAPRRLGLGDAREGARWLMNDTVPVRTISHAVDRYIALSGFAGADVTGDVVFPLPQGNKPDIKVPDGDYVIVHPFARGGGKALTEEEVSGLIEALAPLPVVLAGISKGGKMQAGNMFDATNSTTLPELIWLLRHAAYTISVDSGPMHIAAGLGENVLAIHTWSNPEKVGPYSGGCAVWKNGRLSTRANHQPTDGPTRPAPEHLREIANFVRDQIDSGQ